MSVTTADSLDLGINVVSTLSHVGGLYLKYERGCSKTRAFCPTLVAIPVSCLMCWLSLAVFFAMLWELRRLILSLMVRVSVFLYLSATITE